jgi:hypothetical protein
MLGDVASIITTGQKVLPAKALALGYSFKYPHLADALRAIAAYVPHAPAPPEPVQTPHGASHH